MRRRFSIRRTRLQYMSTITQLSLSSLLACSLPCHNSISNYGMCPSQRLFCLILSGNLSCNTVHASSPSSPLAFFTPSLVASSSALRLPATDTRVLLSSVGAATVVFFFRTSPVRSFALSFAASIRAFASAGVSPSVAPRIPVAALILSGTPAEPFSAVLTSTGGARRSTSCVKSV